MHRLSYAQCLQGEDLLKIVKEDEYVVRVGQEFCENVNVTMKEITCLPPRSEPDDPTSDKTTVKVLL